MTRSLLALAPLRIEARAVAAGAPAASVERTGIGPRRAAAAAGRLRGGVAGRDVAVVVTGVGGALVDGLAPGELVVADRVLRPSGEEVAHLPGAGLLAAELRLAGLAVSVGAVLSTSRLVTGLAARARLATTGAIAVDMESAALLEEPWGVPTAVVRAVSDRPGQDLWSPATVTNGLRALQSLRAAAATLETWAAVTGARRVLLDAPNSLCAGVERATQDRQDAVVAFAAHCDLVLVVGSPGLSNSHRLVEVGRRAGRRTELVATGSDVRYEWLRGVRTVGITAGASTPEPLVQEVVDALGGLGPLDIELRPLRRETVSFPLSLEVR